MEASNGVLLQLIECIESTQNEVKRKMIESGSDIEARKSPDRLREKIRDRKSRLNHRRVWLHGGLQSPVLESNVALRWERDAPAIGARANLRSARRNL